VIENRSLPPGPVVPFLLYNHVPRAIEWLSGAFGFAERLRTPPEPDGSIHLAQLSVGEGSVMLRTRPAAAQSQAAKAAHFILVRVEDVDGHCRHAQDYGARILREPKDAEFGERQYTAEDIEGNQWTFSQSIADVAPEDWGGLIGEVTGRLARLKRPRVCYLEIPSPEPERSADFYERVFGWNIRHRETERPSFDDATGNVSGAFVTGLKASREPGILVSIWVDSIDATLDSIRANGGEVVEEAHPDELGGSSFIATFRDPAGNALRLYQEN
jgi:predicted enzyme related to lactoylglutathione lyase